MESAIRKMEYCIERGGQRSKFFGTFHDFSVDSVKGDSGPL